MNNSLQGVIRVYWLQDQESTQSNMNFQNLTWFETVYCSRCKSVYTV